MCNNQVQIQVEGMLVNGTMHYYAVTQPGPGESLKELVHRHVRVAIFFKMLEKGRQLVLNLRTAVLLINVDQVLLMLVAKRLLVALVLWMLCSFPFRSFRL